MQLELFKGDYAVCSLNNELSSPIFINTNDFYYITNIENKLILVCSDDNIPKEAKIDKSWKILKILEPLTLYLVGILSEIEKILIEVKISIFKISTYDSDYILVKTKDIDNAYKALIYNGYEIV